MLKRVPSQQTIVDHQRSLCRTVMSMFTVKLNHTFSIAEMATSSGASHNSLCLSHVHKGWCSEWSHNQKLKSVLNLDIKITSIIFDLQNGAVTSTCFSQWILIKLGASVNLQLPPAFCNLVRQKHGGKSLSQNSALCPCCCVDRGPVGWGCLLWSSSLLS